MRASNILDAFNCAIEGLIYVLKTERNMRVHMLFAIFILVLGIYLNLEALEMAALCIVITLVICTELVNTATEFALDLVSDGFNPLARVIKDVAAAAVFIASANAVIVGYLILSKRLLVPVESGILRIQQSQWHVTLISLIVVIGLVVLGKVVSRRGRPLAGGMPSGHAALAFSLWTVIAFATKSEIVILLSFFMAVLIAWGRVQKQVHDLWEIICGGLLGILVTTLIVQILQQ